MLRAFHLLASAVMLAIGVWMLAAPVSWFHHFPAGMPDTGPFNPHLVRDLGVAFTVMGVALACSVRDRRHSRVVHLIVTAFLVAHALVHVGELLGGRLPHRHWWLDIPFTFLPALLFLALLPAALRRADDGHPHAPSS